MTALILCYYPFNFIALFYSRDAGRPRCVRKAHSSPSKSCLGKQLNIFWDTDRVLWHRLGALPGPPFLVKPAQRYLPEVLCCRKGIIQSLIPCHTATKWDNNTPYEACLSSKIIKVVNDKPHSCLFLVVNSGECKLCASLFMLSVLQGSKSHT